MLVACPLALLFPGCGKDGDPGPQGIPGTQGATGAAGADGKSSFQLSTDYGNIQNLLPVSATALHFPNPSTLTLARTKAASKMDSMVTISLIRYGEGSNNKMSFYLSFEKNQMSVPILYREFFKEITGAQHSESMA